MKCLITTATITKTPEWLALVSNFVFVIYIRMHKVLTYSMYKQTYTHTHYTSTEYLIRLVGGLGPHEGCVGFGRCISLRFAWCHYLLMDV